MSKHVIYGRECDKKEGDFNRAHLFPRVSRYKRGSDIKEVRVYRGGFLISF